MSRTGLTASDLPGAALRLFQAACRYFDASISQAEAAASMQVSAPPGGRPSWAQALGGAGTTGLDRAGFRLWYSNVSKGHLENGSQREAFMAAMRDAVAGEAGATASARPG